MIEGFSRKALSDAATNVGSDPPVLNLEEERGNGGNEEKRRQEKTRESDGIEIKYIEKSKLPHSMFSHARAAFLVLSFDFLDVR